MGKENNKIQSGYVSLFLRKKRRGIVWKKE